MAEIPTPDPNPPLITWTKTNGVLEKKTTHKDPVVKRESFNIAGIKLQLNKIDGVIAMWEAKKIPLQEIIDKDKELDV